MILTIATAAAGDWPDFRGPTMQGHVPDAAVPLSFSERQHVKWKTAVPGEGWSSPVVADGQVWLTTSMDQGRRLHALGFDAATGKLIHDVSAFTPSDADEKHALNSYASPSPAIEPGRVYVHFGTYGTAAIDTGTGKIVWRRTDLNIRHSVGPGSSPVLFENVLILTMDGTDVQYTIGLDKHTGRTMWKTDRSLDLSKRSAEQKKSFSTPIIAEVNGRPQLISSGPHAIYGYDPLTGKEIWRCGYGFGYSCVPRPVVGGGMVFVSTSYDQADLLAIRLGGAGDVTDTHVAWRINRGQITRRPSPLLIGETLYMVSDMGIAQAFDARSGKVLWKERMGGQFCASPIYADGRMYFFDQEGTVTVLQPGSSYTVLATSKLDEGFMASPAVLDNSLILRTKTHLYRIEH